MKKIILLRNHNPESEKMDRGVNGTDQYVEKIIEIARTELFMARQSLYKDPENRLYSLAVDAMETLINSKDPKGEKLFVPQPGTEKEFINPATGNVVLKYCEGRLEHSPELNLQSMHLLLYLIDTYIRGVSIEIDEHGEMAIINEEDDGSREFKLVHYLLEQWIVLSSLKSFVPFGLFEIFQ